MSEIRKITGVKNKSVQFFCEDCFNLSKLVMISTSMEIEGDINDDVNITDSSISSSDIIRSKCAKCGSSWISMIDHGIAKHVKFMNEELEIHTRKSSDGNVPYTNELDYENPYVEFVVNTDKPGNFEFIPAYLKDDSDIVCVASGKEFNLPKEWQLWEVTTDDDNDNDFEAFAFMSKTPERDILENPIKCKTYRNQCLASLDKFLHDLKEALQ